MPCCGWFRRETASPPLPSARRWRRSSTRRRFREGWCRRHWPHTRTYPRDRPPRRRDSVPAGNAAHPGHHAGRGIERKRRYRVAGEIGHIDELIVGIDCRPHRRHTGPDKRHRTVVERTIGADHQHVQDVVDGIGNENEFRARDCGVGPGVTPLLPVPHPPTPNPTSTTASNAEPQALLPVTLITQSPLHPRESKTLGL